MPRRKHGNGKDKEKKKAKIGVDLFAVEADLKRIGLNRPTQEHLLYY